MELIETAVGSEADAERLAKGLLDAGLVACVSILPQRSIYRWKGKLCDEREWLLRCKTASLRVVAAAKWLREQHPYEIAEVVSYSAIGHNPKYSAWLAGDGP